MKKKIVLNVVVFLMIFGFVGKIEGAEVELTYVPPYGSSNNLQGQVSGVSPSDYYVWVYVYVPPYGWWTKPHNAWPRTSIGSDGSWVCDITTGGQDIYATKVIAFLVPDTDNLSVVSGDQCLASWWYDYPYIEAIRFDKINFSGYDWLVKKAYDKVGPGPNYFSDSEDNVWVDENDHLHLAIIKEGENWYCSEVIADFIGGYGTYIFTVKGRVDLLDKNIVLGLFTWEDCVPAHNYREIDIEFAKWGDSTDPYDGQYVIQPWDTPGNMVRFDVDCVGCNTTTNIFTWSQDKICFRSYYGDFSLVPAAENMVTSWFYTGSDIPPPGSENPRINFWLMSGLAPSDNQGAEIIIKNFQYIPDTRPEIDFFDFSVFAPQWLKADCDSCEGAALDEDQDVDFNDLKILTDNWLDCSFLQ